MQKLYTPNEVAGLLRLEADEVLRLVRAGRLRAYSIAGEIRIGEDDLGAFVENCALAPDADCSSKSTQANKSNDSNHQNDLGPERRHDCQTFGGRAVFTYSGSVATGTTIWPGAKATYRLVFDAGQWASLLKSFRGTEIRAGLNFAHPEPGSFGEWIKVHWNTKMGPAAYVGGILIHEGYAERVRPGWIKFFDQRHPNAH